jgi:outer membrane usher protein
MKRSNLGALRRRAKANTVTLIVLLLFSKCASDYCDLCSPPNSMNPPIASVPAAPARNEKSKKAIADKKTALPKIMLPNPGATQTVAATPAPQDDKKEIGGPIVILGITPNGSPSGTEPGPPVPAPGVDPTSPPNSTLAVAPVPPSVPRTVPTNPYGTPLASTEVSGDSSAEIPISVYLDRRRLGTEMIKLKPGETVTVERLYVAALLADLKKVLDSGAYERLREQLGSVTFVSGKDLESLDVIATFRVEDSAVEISVPKNWLNPTLVSFNRSDESDIEPNVFTAPFSGYVNFDVTKRYLSPYRASEADLSAPYPNYTSVDAQGVLSAKNVTLQSGFNKYENVFNRTETSLVIPWNLGLNSVVLGDIKYDNAMAVPAPELSGVGYYRRSALKTEHLEIDAGVVDVKNKSILYIYKNERLYRTLDVPPGKFQMSNLPLDLGQNVIRLVLKDQVTGEETERVVTDYLPLYSIPYGDWEHAIVFGSKRTNDIRGIQYLDQPVTFAGVMYGLTRQINVGGNFYNDPGYRRYSNELRLFTNAGTFGFGVNHSNRDFYPDGTSAHVEISKNGFGNSALQSAAVRYSLMDTTYKAGLTDNSNGGRTESSLNLGIRASQRVALGLGATFLNGENESLETYFATLGSKFKPSKHWQIDLSGGYYLSNGKSEEYKFLVALKYEDVLKNDAHVSALVERTQEHLAEQARYLKQDDFSVTGSNSKQIKTGSTIASVQAEKKLPIAILSGEVMSTDEGQTSAATTTLSTAFAFTNETIALSRPISESFLIIESKNKRGVEFDVNDSLGRPIETGGKYLRGVVLPVSNYGAGIYSPSFQDPNYFTVESSEGVTYMPGYKTGAAYFLVSDDRILLNGFLVDEKNNHLKDIRGELICQDKEDALTDTFFTKAEGDFEVYVKRGALCRLKYGNAVSEPLDSNWPTKFREVGTIELRK